MTSKTTDEIFVAFGVCDGIIEDLDALEQSIVDICPIDMVQAIHERKRMIRKR